MTNNNPDISNSKKITKITKILTAAILAILASAYVKSINNYDQLKYENRSMAANEFKVSDSLVLTGQKDAYIIGDNAQSLELYGCENVKIAGKFKNITISNDKKMDPIQKSSLTKTDSIEYCETGRHEIPRNDEIQIGSSNIKLTGDTDYLWISYESQDITLDGNVTDLKCFNEDQIEFGFHSNIKKFEPIKHDIMYGIVNLQQYAPITNK